MGYTEASMSIHQADKESLQKFLGQYLEGGVQRAQVFKKIFRYLAPFPVQKIPTLLKILEKTFGKGFADFKRSKGTALRVRMRGAISIFTKSFKDLEPAESKALLFISVYLLLILVSSGSPALMKIRKVV